MKPHKHKDLIIAWANGASIEAKKYYKNHLSVELSEFWEVAPNPTWYDHTEYRIKPREFKEGAFYPVLDVVGEEDMACYSHGNFYLTGETAPSSLEDLTWIGEPLNIEWPEAE